MPSREYLRRQAELCFKLAVLSTEDISRHLIARAEDYRARAAELQLRRWRNCKTRQASAPQIRITISTPEFSSQWKLRA
jgi:hypothetical protein